MRAVTNEGGPGNYPPSLAVDALVFGSDVLK